METRNHTAQPSRNLPLHPGINFSKTEVGGDLGGFVFAAGSVVAVLIGLPMVAPWYLASVALGVLLAIAIGIVHGRNNR